MEKFIQEELLKRNNKLFFIILYGCGGVIFLKHFYHLLGHRDTSLLQKMIDSKLIKIKRVGKNQVVILKYAVFCHFNLPNKSIKFTDNRLLHSALFCEMMLHTFNSDELVKIEQLLNQSNFAFFHPRNSYYILNRIYSFLSSKNEGDLTALKYSLKELNEKICFIESSTKGRKNKLPEKTVKTDDLLTLKSNDIYVKGADYKEGTIRLHVAVLATDKTADKIIRAIIKAETALNDMLSGINIKLYFDIYSLEEKSSKIENKVYTIIIRQQPLKEDSYKETIRFHWYNCKNRLFSGIDINKWL